jgi:hypothetical protein
VAHLCENVREEEREKGWKMRRDVREMER